MAAHAEEVLSMPVSETDPYAVDRSCWEAEGGKCMKQELCLSVVVIGASGDLAKKKTFPALATLFSRDGFLPNAFSAIGYARSDYTDASFRDKLRPTLGVKDGVADDFLGRLTYVRGQYTESDGFAKLNQVLTEKERAHDGGAIARLFYLAVPPSVYPDVLAQIKEQCSGFKKDGHPDSWLRVIVEKPFGRDLESAEDLSCKISSLFAEEQIYRIDHFLGKELSQNMLVMRFANTFLGAVWNRTQISNVQIVMKEPFGTEGRGGFFDDYGVIRDVVQNHLLQVLALVTMERPVTMHPDDVRDEKTKVIRSMRVVGKDDVVLGQYAAANGKPGYTDDDSVPDGSQTATYAAVRLWIDNDRWEGVPFVIKTGKALNEKKLEVRVQFRTQPGYFAENANEMRNEFVMRLQPNEAMYMKMVVKKPGLGMEHVMSELNLTYNERYNAEIPEAYERLILDAINGNQQHYVRRDELRASWAIFTPVLHAIDKGEGPPLLKYPYGARGVPEGDELLARGGYVRTKDYSWEKDAKSKM